MKNAVIIVSGAPEGNNQVEVSLPPGATARDVTTSAGLNGYLLSRFGSGGGQYFAENENVYEAIEDGDKLSAVPVASVGK